MQHKTIFFIYLLTAFVLMQSSCGLLSVQGPEAAFIEIPSIEFTHNAEKGPYDHNIKHIEVFFEGSSLGYYEVPLTLAVIPTMETSSLVIRPAIRENGKANGITNYIMMTNHTVTQKFEVDEFYTIIPQFDYAENLIFDYVETFESGNSIEFDLDNIDTSRMVRTQDEARNGASSGLLSGEIAEATRSATDFVFTDLDNGGRDVYLEMSYLNNDDFIFGLVAVNTGFPNQEIPLINLVDRDEWNKLYVKLTNIILNNPAEGYRLYYQLDASSSTSKVFIDNVKLLHIP